MTASQQLFDPQQRDHALLAGTANATPRHIRLLEGGLILYAVFASGLVPVILTVVRKVPFSEYWDPGWVWINTILYNASALGILGYILHFRWRKPVEIATESTSQRGGGVRGFLELLLVLWVALALSIYQSMSLLLGRATIADLAPSDPVTSDFFGIIHQAGALGILSYVLYRNSSGFKDLGLRWTAWDAAWTLPLMIASQVVYSLSTHVLFWGWQIVAGHAIDSPNLSPYLFGTQISMVSVLALVLNGFFEELIVRAYLMTIVTRLTRSTLLAICLSVIVQISYHFYQGTPLALNHVAWFLLLAAYYSATKRILPVILAHVAVDLMSLLHYADTLSSVP